MCRACPRLRVGSGSAPPESPVAGPPQRWVASAPGGPSCHHLASGTITPRTPSGDRRRGGAAAFRWSDPAARPLSRPGCALGAGARGGVAPVVTGDGARSKAPVWWCGVSSGIRERHRLPAGRLQRGPHPPGLGVVLHARRRQPGERSRAYGRVGLAHEYGSREHGRSASGGAVAASRAAAAA